MPEDIALQMPTDLRPDLPLQLDSSDAPRTPKGIIFLTVDIPSSASKVESRETRPPSRWKTPEFLLYEVIFAIVVPILVLIPIKLSSTSHRNYPLFRHRLSPGWLLGREVDNSDAQYRSFRNNLPTLALLVAVFFMFKYMYQHLIKRPASSLHSSNQLYRVPFLVAFSTIMLMGLHGTSALKIFVILTLNYSIAKYCRGSKTGPIFTWLFNVAILFANERNSGYKFGILHPSLEVLDSINGAYPRWHGWDRRCSKLDYKQRTSIPHSLDDYTFTNYIAYVLYPPLYIAGPIMTFNDFIWQLRRSVVIPTRTIASYGLRFLACLLTMEFVLHFMYVVAIKDAKAWQGDTPFELSMIGLWNLVVVWLKLLLPWRFFRLWALMDGIEPQENMIRCVANNYSPLGFWRSWHRSYNLWIVRYIYIPLGGTKNVAVNNLLIFTFVALWHDLSFRLLAWGWLVSLFILPELAARYFVPASKYADRPWYRHICAAGAVFSILLMMSANLVGFVIGTDGMTYMVKQLMGTWEGLQFSVVGCVCLFVAAQMMFEYREEEMRQGIYRRC